MEKQVKNTNRSRKGPQGKFKGKRPFIQREDVVPYDKLTEAQRIAEGLRPPFVQKFDFSKSKHEKKLLKKLKSSKKGPTGGAITINGPQAEQRLTVHTKGCPKTTYSFMVKPKDVDITLLIWFYGETAIYQNSVPTKITYRGEVLPLRKTG